MATYELGSLDGSLRPLICRETGDAIAMVACDEGPAIIGVMTEERARRIFPEAWVYEDDADDEADLDGTDCLSDDWDA